MNKKRKRKASRKQERKRDWHRVNREVAETLAAERAKQRRKRAEEEAEREKSIAVAFMSHQNAEQKFRQRGLSFRLRYLVLHRAKKLMDPRVFPGLCALGRFVDESTWCRRNMDSWKPKGKSPFSQFRSLVKHMLVEYTMPEFMYSAFFEEDEQVRNHGLRLFCHLAKGGSMHKAVKAGMLPVPLTKRMCHVFMQSTSKFGFLEAIRHAQVTVHGGDRRLYEMIVSTRQLGRGFSSDEVFWDGVIQWTCNQGMLAPSQIQAIYDWIAWRRTEAPQFSMKGRTGVSVLRSVEEWHGHLARERKINGHTYEPSGFNPWFHERKVKLPDGGYFMEKHCITEIATSKELAAEGRALKHCVYSYSHSIQRGVVSIWSYKVGGSRTLTIEVDNRTRRVVQCRGALNLRPTKGQMALVTRWMKDNSLIKASWLVGV